MTNEVELLIIGFSSMSISYFVKSLFIYTHFYLIGFLAFLLLSCIDLLEFWPMFYEAVILLCGFSFHFLNSRFQTGGIFIFDEAQFNMFSLMLHDLETYIGNCCLIQSYNDFLLSVLLEDL